MAITGLSQYIAMDNTKQTKHIVTVNEQLHRKQVYVRWLTSLWCKLVEFAAN